MPLQSEMPLQQQKWTLYLVFCNLVIVLGSSFIFGYNLGVVNAPFAYITAFVNESYTASTGHPMTKEELGTQWSVIVSLYLIGSIVGSTWFPGALAKSVGKKHGLIISGAIGAIGAAIMFISPWTHSYVPLMVGRAVLGVQTGVSMTLAPGLVTEIAPGPLRGACGSLIGIGITIGYVLANLLGLKYLLATTWQYLFLFELGICILNCIGLIFVVESPRWLIDRDRPKDAIIALQKLRKADESDISAEFEIIRKQSEEDSTIKVLSVLDYVRRRRLWWPLIIAIQLHIMNAVTGLIANAFYSAKVMNEAGMDSDIAALATFGISCCTVFGAVASLIVVDRAGRRLTMYISLAGVTLALIYLTIVLHYKAFFASIAGFAVFHFIFSVGPGPIPWYMCGEIFDHDARPVALSVGTFTNWVGTIVSSFIFPAMVERIGEYSFLPFAGVAFLELIFCVLFLPETSHKLASFKTEDFDVGNSLVQFRRKPKNKQQAAIEATDIEKPSDHQNQMGNSEMAATEK